MAQGDRQRYLSRRDQLVEQVIRRQVVIADGAEGVIQIPIPDDANVFLKGIGYDYFGTATYKLQDNQRTLHKGSNQIGSVALPQQWSVPYFLRGSANLYITNNTGASQTFTAVFILHTDKLIELESQGTSVAFPISSASGSFTDVRMYGQDTGGTDHVVITDGDGNLVVQLEAAPTIEIGDVGIMGDLSGTDTKITATTVGSDTALDVNVVSLVTISGIHEEDTAHTTGDLGSFSLAVRTDSAGTLVSTDGDYAPIQVDATGALRIDIDNVSGAAISATNPIFCELTDGAAVVDSSNPLNIIIGDGTTQAGVTAALTAVKVDLVGTNGGAFAAANPLAVELTDGSNFISGLNPLSVTNIPQSTLLAGTKTTATDAAIALASSTSCKKVTVQADNANTTVMYIGNATSQTVELYAGDSIDIEINDLDTIYIRRTAGGADVTANYVGS